MFDTSVCLRVLELSDPERRTKVYRTVKQAEKNKTKKREIQIGREIKGDGRYDDIEDTYCYRQSHKCKLLTLGQQGTFRSDAGFFRPRGYVTAVQEIEAHTQVCTKMSSAARI